MNEFLLSRNAIVTDWYYSIEADGPRRKPNPGMLMEAAQKHSIDLASSIMIGDKVSDIFHVDKAENRPATFIVKGAYDLSSIETQRPLKVSILNNHQEMLSVVSALFSR
jgi:D-glycero-D-manno-heptose 1,7-bisphosphate phosphatase